MFRSSDFDVRDAVRTILRRRRMVMTSVLAFVALALVLNQVTQPVFRTAARLAIEPVQSRSPLTGATVETPTPNSENLTLLTTAERILSREVLERVALEMHREGIVLRPESSRLGFSIGASAARAASPAAAQATLRDDVEQLLKTVSVRPVRDTRLVDVQAEHWSPAAAAAIANSVAAQFVAGEARHRQELNAERLAALRLQIDDVRHSIEAAEQSLYGSSRSSLALADERSRQLTGAAVEAGSGLLKARSERRAVEAELQRIREFQGAGVPDWSHPPIQTPALDDLYRQLQKVETDMAALRQLYKDQSPELSALDNQARALRDAMRRELLKAASDLDGQRHTLLAREQSLQQTAASTEETLKALSDSTYKYSTLESRLATQRDVYTLLLKRVQEQEIAQTIEPPSVELVQAAAVPLRSVRPRKAINIAVGLVLGLVFGTGLALALDSIRRTIRTPRDVVHELHLPVVGMIPRRP